MSGTKPTISDRIARVVKPIVQWSGINKPTETKWKKQQKKKKETRIVQRKQHIQYKKDQPERMIAKKKGQENKYGVKLKF